MKPKLFTKTHVSSNERDVTPAYSHISSALMTTCKVVKLYVSHRQAKNIWETSIVLWCIRHIQNNNGKQSDAVISTNFALNLKQR